MNKEFYKTKFSMCNEMEDNFEGYTIGDTWNGWATPYFVKEEGLKLVTAIYGLDSITNDTVGCFGFYNEKEDCFIFSMECDNTYTKKELEDNFELCLELENKGEVDIFKGKDIQYKNENIHVYPIGAYCWIWLEE